MLSRTPLEQLLTVDNVAAWLRTMPAEGRYDYKNGTLCPVAQFCAAHGHGVFVSSYFVTHNGRHIGFADEIENAVREMPHTYGAALARLEAVL